ncbi:monofunctional biosynthetic peptidoglycan transglycosylase [uncultured Thiothrix sp.]|uniref:monofunctional biosynthetic peptidoglycan transglycosylase n=1 Tax=uncultured Thiothrix sp. TaxID=223185 RepID=UPI002633B18D|nr:monofunctional biosynthetic peptidoglycan transglycosylase [uncultured Thiothrix sp.]HMT94964.1 monofunctional biosynthetic peptidoglycan transglycosylase [Thiolinea sp.]
MLALPRFKLTYLHWLWRIPLLLFLLVVLLLLIFRVAPVPTSSFMLQQSVVSWFDDSVPSVHHHWVSMEEIPPQVALAAVAAEDQLFPEHWGIDRGATERAIQAALEGESNGGGSTITQQVAKNLFLWGGRSYVRKGMEWGLAVLIETLWSKDRILEVYLNIAQFSAADYGVGAASDFLFKKPVAKLSEADAALLAAVLPLPEVYSVVKPSRYIQKRQRFILRQMRQLGGVAYLERL